ncbi:MAG: hypothetical protein MJ132_08700 [Clostridia bacterium]|nr:hypothetical protein [Clostridia bacterium]
MKMQLNNNISRFIKGNIKSHDVLIVRRKVTDCFKILLRTVFLIGMGYVMLYPILFMISGAFKAGVDVYDPTVIWLPKHYSTQAMSLAFKTLKFETSIKQTLLILIPSVVLQLISTLLASYGFARFKFKERGFLFGCLIFTIIVPIQNLIVPGYGCFQRCGIFGIGYLIGAGS